MDADTFHNFPFFGKGTLKKCESTGTSTFQLTHNETSKIRTENFKIK